MAKFRLGEKWDLDLEATNAFLDDNYDGQVNNNKLDGHVNVLVGLTYRFKNHDGSRQFTFARYDHTKFNTLNTEVNRLQSDIDAAKNKVVYETRKVDGSRVNTLVAFEPKSSALDKLQEVNVFTAAEEMKKMSNDADLYITVNSSAPAQNNELFLQRAQTIRDILVNQYNVPAGRIFVESNPAVVASLDKTKKCVVVLINE